ncbi:MAG: hypothetical protein J2P48_08510 [Alphaproteobacteria bacterium]|nr:hypothetical protein [Alphaproteobacteria bacterium]
MAEGLLDHDFSWCGSSSSKSRDFLDYSRRFGPAVSHPSKSTHHPDYTEITRRGVNKFDADGRLIDAIYRRGAGAVMRAPSASVQGDRLYSLIRWWFRAERLSAND